jgi:flagellar biosynthesis/type III secretory pathway M-ring protein FliF/YscJ
LILLFLLAYGLLLRPLKKQLITTFRELPTRRLGDQVQTADITSAEIGSGHALAGLSNEERAAVLKKQLVDKVKIEPAATGKLIQSWLNEGAS